jgi:YD repeat-containing protein
MLTRLHWYVVAVTHDARGRPVDVTTGNGVTAHRTYDAASGRMTALELSGILKTQKLHLDRMGRVKGGEGMANLGVALQPFGVREEMGNEAVGTLRAAAGLGYRAVELVAYYGTYGLSAAELKQTLASWG